MEEIQIKQLVSTFMKKYFEEVDQITEFNLSFLEKNEFYEPTVNYIKIRRFIATAANNLKALDPKIVEGLLGKLYNDINRLTNYEIEFVKKNKVSSNIFKRDFLGGLKIYQDMANEVRLTESMRDKFYNLMLSTESQLQAMGQPKTKEDINEYKILKRRNVDSLHHYMESKEKLIILHKELIEFEKAVESEFFNQFNEYRNYYIESLEKIINIKTYYFDKLLWAEAKKSEPIRKFFKDAQIKGDYDLKTFIQYYLRNVNVEQTRDTEWHGYLLECLKILE